VANLTDGVGPASEPATAQPTPGRAAQTSVGEAPAPHAPRTGQAVWLVARAKAPAWGAFLGGFVHAWHGLVHAIRTQRNARVHAFLGACAVALGLWLGISPVEFAMVFVAITGVFIAEMFNTVAEACVDLVTDEYHPLARIAKDVAAGAVLLNAMLSVMIGLLVFLPHMWLRFAPLLWPYLGPLRHILPR
jgi:diacylglycerol kinase